MADAEPPMIRTNASADDNETLLSNLARRPYLRSLTKALRLPEAERATLANVARFDAAVNDVFTLCWLSQKRRAGTWMQRLGGIADGVSLVFAVIDLILNSSVPFDDQSSAWWAHRSVRSDFELAALTVQGTGSYGFAAIGALLTLMTALESSLIGDWRVDESEEPEAARTEREPRAKRVSTGLGRVGKHLALVVRSPALSEVAARTFVDIAVVFVGGDTGLYTGVENHRPLLWSLFSRGVYRAHDAERLANAWMQVMYAFEHPFTPDPMLDGLPVDAKFIGDVVDNIDECLVVMMRDTSALRARFQWWATAPRMSHGSLDLDTLARMDMPLSGARDLLTGKIPSGVLASSLPSTVLSFARHVYSVDPASPHTRTCDIMPMLVAAATRSTEQQLAAWIDKGLIELIVRLAISPGRAQPTWPTDELATLFETHAALIRPRIEPLLPVLVPRPVQADADDWHALGEALGVDMDAYARRHGCCSLACPLTAPAPKLLLCNHCKLAQFCSPACAATAWPASHRRSCKLLKVEPLA